MSTENMKQLKRTLKQKKKLLRHYFENTRTNKIVLYIFYFRTDKN